MTRDGEAEKTREGPREDRTVGCLLVLDHDPPGPAQKLVDPESTVEQPTSLSLLIGWMSSRPISSNLRALSMEYMYHRDQADFSLLTLDQIT